VSFAIFFSSAWPQHPLSPARPRDGPEARGVREKGGFAALGLTLSDALARAKVQSDLGKRTWRVPNSTNLPEGRGP